MTYDIIIIGSGISGLALSYYLPKNINAIILCKEEPDDCNTFYAQGGVALSRDAEDVELHIKDTVEAGCDIGNRDAIRYLCENSKARIDELIDDGLVFDKNKKGELAYTKEGAHTISRIIHCDGDATGMVMHSFFLKKLKHNLRKNSTVVDLLIKDSVCYGVSVWDGEKIENLYAKTVVIASGGIGSLFQYHTNAPTISGDMQGLIVEKGGKLENMEMLQFHPTVFVQNRWARKFLLSEALRGEGAYIVDEDGYRFLFDYDTRGELAPRDIVSRAIFDYKERYKKDIYLSFEPFSEEFFKQRFPNIYRNLISLGYNLPQDKIPISPAFHYAMGGIKCDLDGRVESFSDLYALGEVACNGLHGANRLASNSLLESIVFGKKCADSILSSIWHKNYEIFDIPTYQPIKDSDHDHKEKLRSLMWKNVGIIRKRDNLLYVLDEVESMLDKEIGRMLRLRLLCAREIIISALNRKESLGAHFVE